MEVAVVGAGSWGTAVARHLALQGHRVRLWSRGEEVARGVNETHRNPRYISSCDLPASLVADTVLGRCLEGAEAAVYVVPSHALRRCARARPTWAPSSPSPSSPRGSRLEPESS